MIPLKKKWGGLATTKITADPELFELLVRSGCGYLLIGFESISQRALTQIHKGFNTRESYDEVMRRLHKARIIVQGCFVFGFDEDDTDVFAATVDEVQRLKIDIPRYSIYTPYPGTHLFQRLQAEGRILSYDWGDYDTMHVVFQPHKMTPVELYEGFRWAYRETFPLEEHSPPHNRRWHAVPHHVGRQHHLPEFRASDSHGQGLRIAVATLLGADVRPSGTREDVRPVDRGIEHKRFDISGADAASPDIDAGRFPTRADARRPAAFTSTGPSCPSLRA